MASPEGATTPTGSRQQTLAFVDDRTIDEKFAEWIEGHGAEVYRLFVEIANEIRDAGQARYSSKAIVEIARYFRVVRGRDKDGWKINNSYTSMLSRKLMTEDPSFLGWFETRKLKDER